MTSTDVNKAEAASRFRALLMAMMAALLLWHTYAIGGDDLSTMNPVLRHGGWGFAILAWLLVLSTGGFATINPRVKRLMNDEVARANRSRALQTGFWTAMLVGLALYFAILRWEVGIQHGLRILLNLTVAAALARYAWLELR
jgi:hypothetical protein